MLSKVCEVLQVSATEFALQRTRTHSGKVRFNAIPRNALWDAVYYCLSGSDVPAFMIADWIGWGETRESERLKT